MLKVIIEKSELSEILFKEESFRLSFSSFDEFVNGDLNLDPLNHLMGGKTGQMQIAFDFENNLIIEVDNLGNLKTSVEEAKAVCNRIANAESNPDEDLDEAFGGFFDGGDDCDYAGSYVLEIIDAVKYILFY